MKNFEIEVRVKKFVLAVIQLTDKLPKKTSSFVIERQLLRSVTSIGANLIEGKGGVSKNDFINFLSIARKSAIETDYWLDLLAEAGLVDLATIVKYKSELTEITKIISSIIIKTKSNSK